ncbi:MAG TPA: hypothetical protein VFL87_05685 [Thermoleophilaceae bacterium]|nr:hypothetical protein [Thermoleophilaceae bacterium]
MKKLLSYGGIAASVVLIVFGLASIVIAANGRSEVRSDIKREAVVGTPDMTPQAIKGEAAKAGLKNVTLPSCSVANKAIETGSQAKCFASYMRVHVLEATGGKTYAELPRYATTDGKGTNDAKAALARNGQPVNNPLRDLWTQEFALTTALNTSYFAEQVSMFSIVMGVALLLSGAGFLVLTVRLLFPAVRREETHAEKPAKAAVPATSH